MNRAALRRLAPQLVCGALAALATAACGRTPVSEASAEVGPVAAPVDEVPVVGPSEAEALRTLPYATWVPVDGDARRGVTVHDEDRAFAGLNLFAPRHLARAFLVDMDGRTLHSWSAQVKGGTAWQHVELLPDGGLVVVDKERMVLRLGFASKLKWAARGEFHHDLAVDPARERVWAIERRLREVTVEGERLQIVDDDLVALSLAKGEVVERMSLWEILSPRIPTWRLEGIRKWRAENGPEAVPPSDSAADLFHTNSIEVLDRDSPPVGRRGDLLVSVRELDLVATIDPALRRVVWRWGPKVLQRQHHPTLLDDGRVLVFDNRPRDLASRVLEVDPATEKVVWSYAGDPPASFFSEKRGGSQRLPNGNTLITESDKGRAIEVDRDGTIVWEYFCPAVQKTAEGRPARAAMFRVTRVFGPALRGLERRMAQRAESAADPGARLSP